MASVASVGYAGRGPLLAGCLTLAATAYVAAFDPARPGHYLTCPLLASTGFYCAACGGLRAVHDLTRADIVGAWGLNPLVVVALPLLVLAWAHWWRRSVGSPRTPAAASDRRSALFAWVFLVIVLAFTIARNLPALAPWLAP